LPGLNGGGAAAAVQPWNQPLCDKCIAHYDEVNDYTHCLIPQSSHHSPAMSSNTQYMISNCAFLVTCSKTHSLHTPLPMRYTSQLMAQQDVAVLD